MLIVQRVIELGSRVDRPIMDVHRREEQTVGGAGREREPHRVDRGFAWGEPEHREAIVGIVRYRVEQSIGDSEARIQPSKVRARGHIRRHQRSDRVDPLKQRMVRSYFDRLTDANVANSPANELFTLVMTSGSTRQGSCAHGCESRTSPNER
jgi:hypothetical protein